YVPAYNEESRIDATLRTLFWCDEIIVVDKYSDDRTVEIAQQYPNVKVVKLKNTKEYSTSEWDLFMENCRTEYMGIYTCSSLVHPALGLRIKELVHSPDFDYDAIDVPYKGYMMGIYETWSPWYSKVGLGAIKTSSIKINKGEVHTAFDPDIKKKFTIKMEHENEAFIRLSHESADSVIERHRRYWLGEASSPEPLSVPLKTVIRKFLRLLIRKGTFFRGRAGIALAFSFLSYYMLSYVYKWDYKYSNTDEKYRKIKEDMLKICDEYNVYKPSS
ncbi:MAG: glycosyltransferase, partial [Tannerella sp.]|nr:glycosyltransferase [Tannerella sp.]